MMIVCFISAQVALASGGLALLRAWRLRRVPVMTAVDAAILNRRAAVGLVCGAITMTVLPLTHFVVDFSTRWNTLAVTVGSALIVLLLAMLPDVLRAARLRPMREGTAGDLTADLGIDDPRATPRRIVVVAERRDRAGDGRDRRPQRRPVLRDPSWPVRRGGMLRGARAVSGASVKRRRVNRGLGRIGDSVPDPWDRLDDRFS
jgi:hypothetical protein